MSIEGRRELLARIVPRYRDAGRAQRAVMLDEFVAATGYERKYAIRLLGNPPPPSLRAQRPRSRRYGPEVQQALVVAWDATNRVCAKRLVPFLGELVPILEDRGHLVLTEDRRRDLLRVSAATADRILGAIRRKERPHGTSTTKRGPLLKKQVPVRTFADWADTEPGFFKCDLVAHNGGIVRDAFLYTLTLTDIATGWTECLPLPYRTQAAVIQGLERAQMLLPFPLLGIDTDNGSEFLNAELLAYCEREAITFTRGRAYKKNDQCFVEQKNGAVVRQFVGYDRFSGEHAYRQLTELYRALRLYVNFFQPSMKLAAKQRDGSHVTRRFDAAQTPFQRLLASGALEASVDRRLARVYGALDPVVLLHQIGVLQDALWRLVKSARGNGTGDDQHGGTDLARFDGGVAGTPRADETSAAGSEAMPVSRRKYRRERRPQPPRTWRTRPDPFAQVWKKVSAWLSADPERTAKSVMTQLQHQYPGSYPDGQLRTLQRRVKEWRARVIVEYDDGWLREDSLGAHESANPLHAVGVALTTSA